MQIDLEPGDEASGHRGCRRPAKESEGEVMSEKGRSRQAKTKKNQKRNARRARKKMTDRLGHMTVQ